jgi:hypothetical protein
LLNRWMNLRVGAIHELPLLVNSSILKIFRASLA